MAINFPNSPSNGATHTAAGQTFTYDGTAGVWNPQQGTPVSTGTSAPSNPSAGDLWFDTASGTLYFYYADGSSNQWVGVSGPAGADGADGNATVIYKFCRCRHQQAIQDAQANLPTSWKYCRLFCLAYKQKSTSHTLAQSAQ